MADGLPATACPSSRTRNEGKFRRGRGYTSWIPDRLPENEGQVDRETLGQRDLGCHAARVSGIPALGELRFDLAEFGDGIAFVGVVVVGTTTAATEGDGDGDVDGDVDRERHGARSGA